MHQQVAMPEKCPSAIKRRLISSTVSRTHVCICSRSNWRATQWVSHCAKLVHSFAYAECVCGTPLPHVYVILRPALTSIYLCASISARRAARYSYVFYFCDLVTDWLTYFPEPPTTGSALAYIGGVFRIPLTSGKIATAVGHDLHAAYIAAQINENHSAINHAPVRC